MGLPIDEHEKMLALIREAEDERRKNLGDYRKRVEDFAGGAGKKRDGQELEDQEPINHAFEYLSLMIPRWVFSNPKAKVGTELGGTAQLIAQGHEAALGEWMQDEKYAKLLRTIAPDYGLAWGVCHIMPGLRMDVMGREGPGSWRPRTTRIDPEMFVIDPHALSPDEARYMGHMWIADRETLVEQAKQENENGGNWDMDKVRGLEENDNTSLLPEGMQNRKERDEIVGYDLWIPEHQPDEDLGPEDGYNGCIVTIVPSVGYIRKPTPFYGHPNGPYVLFGAYYKPSCPFPLAPLAVTTTQAGFLNLMVAASNKAAKDYRRVILGPKRGDDTAFGGLPDGTYIEVPGMMDQAPVMIEIGGTTDQMLRQIQHAQQQLERVSGMDEAKRGAVTGTGTATEHAIADAASENRASYVSEQFVEGATEVLVRVAWYHHNDGRIEYALSPEAMSRFGGDGQTGGFFVGGSDAEDDIPFEALRMSIVPMSMQRMSEPVQQRNVLQAFQIIAQTVPLIRQYPEAPWRQMLDQVGDALNIPNLTSGYNFELAAMLAGAQTHSSPEEGPPVTIAPEQPGATVRPQAATEEAQMRGQQTAGAASG